MPVVLRPSQGVGQFLSRWRKGLRDPLREQVQVG